jgi:Skp family chaperone for outer membrane proteins
VKRTVVIVAGMLAIGLVAYLGSRLAAEPPGATPPKTATPAAAAPQPQTKVAVMNLSYVIKNYKKWMAFQEEYKKKLEGYDAQLKTLKEQYESKEKELAKMTDAGMKEKLAKDMRELRNQMADKTEDGKKALADMEATQFSTIYKDVQNMTERYAKSRGIELVMHYNDGTTDAEVNNPVNIGRKMSQGGCFPLYVTPGMDISKDVLAYLNQAVDSKYTPAGH